MPPEIQAELAVRAAEAGRHVLLDKPIAGTVDDAERLAAAVERAGVTSMVTLTRRFAEETRSFLRTVGTQRTVGVTATWLSGALLGGEYADSAWRHDGGALMDVGPHVVDLVEAVLGPVTDVPFARRDVDSDTWAITLDHDGRVSQVTLSMRTPVRPSVLRVSASGPDGLVELQDRTTPPDRCYTVLLDEFLDSVRTGAPHECSVHRGLDLQRVLARVTARLAERDG